LHLKKQVCPILIKVMAHYTFRVCLVQLIATLWADMSFFLPNIYF
jgi:hypothetical protein